MLYKGKGYFLIDFEGDPVAILSEWPIKHSPVHILPARLAIPLKGVPQLMESAK